MYLYLPSLVVQVTVAEQNIQVITGRGRSHESNRIVLSGQLTLGKEFVRNFIGGKSENDVLDVL